VNRIRLERFGKSSVALARCSAADTGAMVDQSAYEPLFQSASEVMTNYRRLLAVKSTVPEELAKIGGTAKPKPTAAPSSKMKKATGVQK
jgi:hypothetical protein